MFRDCAYIIPATAVPPGYQLQPYGWVSKRAKYFRFRFQLKKLRSPEYNVTSLGFISLTY